MLHGSPGNGTCNKFIYNTDNDDRELKNSKAFFSDSSAILFIKSSTVVGVLIGTWGINDNPESPDSPDNPKGTEDTEADGPDISGGGSGICCCR